MNGISCAEINNQYRNSSNKQDTVPLLKNQSKVQTIKLGVKAPNNSHFFPVVFQHEFFTIAVSFCAILESVS